MIEINTEMQKFSSYIVKLKAEGETAKKCNEVMYLVRII